MRIAYCDLLVLPCKACRTKPRLGTVISSTLAVVSIEGKRECSIPRETLTLKPRASYAPSYTSSRTKIPVRRLPNAN